LLHSIPIQVFTKDHFQIPDLILKLKRGQHTTVGIGLGSYSKCKKERKIMTTVGIGLGCYGKCKKERNIMTTVGIGLGCYG
jgi:hypothetical protein